jgi:hypothetical protein
MPPRKASSRHSEARYGRPPVSERLDVPTYHRLYHRHMPREDSLSSRFDYLFEPLDDEAAADDAIDVPLEPAPLSTAVPGIPSQAVSVLPPQTTGITSEAQQNIGPGPWQPAPAPQRPSTTSQREPEAGVTNSPTTRAPISVAPETRPPFPNQGPRGGGGPESGGGGILGGLPGPDLPGPL